MDLCLKIITAEKLNFSLALFTLAQSFPSAWLLLPLNIHQALYI